MTGIRKHKKWAVVLGLLILTIVCWRIFFHKSIADSSILNTQTPVEKR